MRHWAPGSQVLPHVLRLRKPPASSTPRLLPEHSANRGQFNTLLQLVFLVFKHKFNTHLLSASCGDPGLDHEALSEAGRTDRGRQHATRSTTQLLVAGL